MKNILTQIFVTLGVIFLILLVVATYFFIADPYNIKPLIFGSGVTKGQVTNTNTTDQEPTSGTNTSNESATGGFQLSEAQKQALINLGIDPAQVPSSISAEQETCFVNALGSARVAEIKAGAVPNALEFLKAKSCI